jgi:hypothetical protein
MTMLVSRTQLLYSTVLLAIAAALVATPGGSRAGEIENAALRPGDFRGRWHGDKVHFIVEKVHKDGQFSGVVRFDKDSRFPDATFAFTGKLSNDGSITIDRDRKNDPQTSHAKAPKSEGGHLIWEGRTTGEDLDPKQKLLFELHIPIPK